MFSYIIFSCVAKREDSSRKVGRAPMSGASEAKGAARMVRAARANIALASGKSFDLQEYDLLWLIAISPRVADTWQKMPREKNNSIALISRYKSIQN